MRQQGAASLCSSGPLVERAQCCDVRWFASLMRAHGQHALRACAIKDFAGASPPRRPCVSYRFCPGWCLGRFPYVAKELGMKKPFLLIALLAAMTAYAQPTGQPSNQQPGAQTQPGQTQSTQPDQQQPGMQQQGAQPGATQQQPGQPGMQQPPSQPGAQQPGQQPAQPPA